MGLYSQFVFPRLCDLALRGPQVGEHRRRLLAQSHGSILEIGFGTGLNLPYYPPGTRRIMAVDPNQGMNRLAQRRSRQVEIVVEQHAARCEQLPFADRSFDCVVSTFTLCSVDDVHQAIKEVHRVLRPGGQFLYLEHGLAPQAKIQRWQRRLNGLQQWLGDGCRLDRDMHELVGTQPFAAWERHCEYLEKTPRTHGYLYRGSATR